MGDEKKSFVSSSMVELKAELFRKQEEFKREKASASGYVRGKKPEKSSKGSIWSRQNPGVTARAQKDAAEAEESNEEEDRLAKSRRALEEKAKLYEQITSSSSIPEEDGSDYYLVDFQKKAIDSIVEEREAKRREEEREKEDEAERHALAAEIPEPSCPDEEWVDFTDSLGRERRCMRKDLGQLIKRDRELALAQSGKKSVPKKSNSSQDSSISNDEVPSLMSSDMHRELMRHKWEAETQQLLEKGQKDIHYSNVQFDEIRKHGVGFFQFSKDHEKREEQLADLKKMREETLDERSRKDRIKDKRKAMMEARLAKVRQRRKLKGGVEEEEVKADTGESEDTIGPKLSDATLTASIEDSVKKEQEKEAEEKRRNHVREWDKDKKPSITGSKTYVDACRDEREPEFAPPSAYFDQPKAKSFQHSDNMRVKRLQASFQTPKSEFAPPDNYEAKKTITSLSEAPCEDTTVQVSDSSVLKSYIPSVPSAATNTHNTSQQVSQISVNTMEDISRAGLYPSYDVSTGYLTSDCNNFSHMNVEQGSTSSQYQQQQPWSQFQHPFDPHHSSLNQNNACQNYQMQQQYHHQQFSMQSMAASSYSQSPLTTTPESDNLQYLSGQTSGYGNPITSGGNPSHTISATTVSGTKRSGTVSEQALNPESHIQKPKIPKMTIVDMRYVKNDVIPSEDNSLAPMPVTAVPYTPGSFTAAKQSTAEQYEESVAESRLKNQISGGPLLYTAEQQQEQKKVLQEESAEDQDMDKKLQEFLSSVRSGSS